MSLSPDSSISSLTSKGTSYFPGSPCNIDLYYEQQEEENENGMAVYIASLDCNNSYYNQCCLAMTSSTETSEESNLSVEDKNAFASDGDLGNRERLMDLTFADLNSSTPSAEDLILNKLSNAYVEQTKFETADIVTVIQTLHDGVKALKCFPDEQNLQHCIHFGVTIPINQFEKAAEVPSHSFCELKILKVQNPEDGKVYDRYIHIIGVDIDTQTGLVLKTNKDYAEKVYFKKFPDIASSRETFIDRYKHYNLNEIKETDDYL